MKLVFMGCGALGSQIAMSIRVDNNLVEEVTFVDDDRVGPENIGTSYFGYNHVGLSKAAVVASAFYQKWRTPSTPYSKTLTRAGQVVGIDKHNFLVIDTFDNPRSRLLTIASSANVIHAMVGEHNKGTVLWDEDYPPPSITYERGYNPICTNNLGSIIIRQVAAYAASSIDEFLRRGRKFSFPVVWRVE